MSSTGRSGFQCCFLCLVLLEVIRTPPKRWHELPRRERLPQPACTNPQFYLSLQLSGQRVCRMRHGDVPTPGAGVRRAGGRHLDWLLGKSLRGPTRAVPVSSQLGLCFICETPFLPPFPPSGKHVTHPSSLLRRPLLLSLTPVNVTHDCVAKPSRHPLCLLLFSGSCLTWVTIHSLFGPL